MNNKNKINSSAYGGDNWKPRSATHQEEIGSLWSNCGVNSEWAPLKRVLLHCPGEEFDLQRDPDSVQMLDSIDSKNAIDQHNALVNAYLDEGVIIDFVDPKGTPSLNQIFCADLFFMTPEGAILARPASKIRAGEEIWVARRFADLGIPILKTLHGNAVFEGADALWINSNRVLLGRGLRTNDEAISQISTLLHEMHIKVIPVDLPIGTMHLMGILRFLAKDLVLVWPYRLAWKAINELKAAGFQILLIPDEKEATNRGSLNFVTLGPRRIIMAEGNTITKSFLESNCVECKTVNIDELLKAAGGIGCLTGIVERELEFDG